MKIKHFIFSGIAIFVIVFFTYSVDVSTEAMTFLFADTMLVIIGGFIVYGLVKFYQKHLHKSVIKKDAI